MTRKQLETLLTTWQARLGLERWDLTVDYDKPTTGTVKATVNRSNTYDRATLTLAKDWSKWDDLKTERTLVHELLHLTTRDIDRVVASAQKSLHPDAWRLLNDRYDHEVEGLVDRLACRLVEIAS